MPKIVAGSGIHGDEIAVSISRENEMPWPDGPVRWPEETSPKIAPFSLQSQPSVLHIISTATAEARMCAVASFPALINVEIFRRL
jgi:hypothetical protein